MTPSDVPESWETYPGSSDGEPAMFFVNTALHVDAPIAAAPELYLVTIDMLDPGDNGTGSREEGPGFIALEDAICEAAAAAGYYFPGRVRHRGTWEMAFYGPAGRDIAEMLRAAGAGGFGRQIRMSGMDDPDWRYFQYLLPDAERWQWIQDYRVVLQLSENGDNLATPRPVDFVAGFPTEAALSEFVTALAAKGFAEGQRSHRPDDRPDLPWSVELQRSDPVTVGHIHDVVMIVSDAAAAVEGVFEGWGCGFAAEPESP